ncbi:hypothetical protein [Nocardiopsis rhodophaea]|uniref:hypothetical protein n=1 Tax=Nocardiopsis rhodophaea TaxID=280238 RepID=UPI0031D5BFFE
MAPRHHPLIPGKLRRRAPAGRAIGAAALVFSAGLAVLYLPGMPAALVWPYEWAIVGAWWLAGAVFLWRLPSVGPGADAEERLIAAVARDRRHQGSAGSDTGG